VDLVVTDIVMPEMSGFTLVDQLSKVRPGVAVLYVSGYPKAEVYWGGTPGVRSAFLGKPLDADELRGTLLALLSPGEKESVSGPTAPPAEERAGVPAPPTHPEARQDVSSALSLQGRILIVDDDEQVVRSLQRLFTRAGYAQPLGLSDPRLVAETLQREEVDLMILDLSMPEMDGFQVLATIQALVGPEEYFPVLMLTGSDDPDTRRRALKAGAMDFLNKPFDPAEAEARVRNLLTARFLNQRVARHRDALEEEVSARTAEIADTRAEILYRLARAAEYRDDVTGRHAERVGLLSAALASELGLPPAEADLIRRTAPLHDVGKIGVPDAILLKPGPLTPAETAVMQSHTTIGAEILGGSPYRILEVARAIALGHHERWDGAGYPHGLVGAAIPLPARIVAVADTFDTITHVRAYQPARSSADALEEIVRCRASHFDPAIVDALKAIVDRVGLDRIQDLASPLDATQDTVSA
jgi:putative two-component system response regulator